MKKITVLILATLMLAATFCGCSLEDGTADTTVSAAIDSNTIDDPSAKDELGDITFSGESFKILSRKSTSYEINSEAISGELISDAVYKRNAYIKDRFKINIAVTGLAGDWGDRNNFMSTVENSIAAGNNDYDLIMTHSAYIINMAIKGQGYDLNDLPSVNLEKKWWCSTYTANSAIGGHSFVAIGDLGHSLYEYIMCLFFNKSLTTKLGLSDIYGVVKDGDWTFEKMKEYALMYSDDKNGDGIFDTNDSYGMAINGHACRMTAVFWDLGLTVKGEDGKHSINLPNEKYLAAYDRLYDFIWNNPQSVNFVKTGGDEQVKLFTNGQIMFFADRLLSAAAMVEMADEFGIVPFPKYDGTQANYITSPNDTVTAYMVLSNIPEPEMVGTVMEALCMEGNRTIVPAYYEATLKYRYLQDPAAVGMLDLIRGSVTSDFAFIYSNSLDLIGAFLGDNLRSQVPSISGLLKSKSTVWKKMLEKLYTDFDKIN